MDIRIERTTTPKQKPTDETKLGFGHIFTDHMFIMNYKKGIGWHDARIVPYQNLSLSPATMCLHYAQEIFEGLKAYRRDDGGVQLFRPEENFKRMNISAERLVIPALPDAEIMVDVLKKFIEIEQDWVPKSKNTSLYIRPFIIATDPYVGVHPSQEYLFMIIASPSGAYYSNGFNPVDIYVEKKYVRAVPGGMGYTKAGGNYAASLAAQQDAEKENYSQVLWLDGIENKYVEEVGSMNIFFVINGEIITPDLRGTVLSGITRKSVIELCNSWGYKVSERRISIDEVVQAYDNNQLNEVFGTGTAAAISPVGHLKYGDKVMVINNGKIGEISQKVYDTLTGIQYGDLEDKFNWITPI